MPDRLDAALSARTRRASLVILLAMTAWMGGSWIGGRLDLPPRFAFLLDLACLGALGWAIVVLSRVLGARQEMKD